jgi:hypothetical protein
MWRFLHAAAFVYFVMGKKWMAIAPEVSNSEKTHAQRKPKKYFCVGKKRKPQKAKSVLSEFRSAHRMFILRARKRWTRSGGGIVAVTPSGWVGGIRGCGARKKEQRAQLLPRVC